MTQEGFYIYLCIYNDNNTNIEKLFLYSIIDGSIKMEIFFRFRKIRVKNISQY